MSRPTACRCRLAVSASLALSVIAGCDGFVGEWMILDGFGKSFAAIETGHTRDQVVAALGQPVRESPVFRLPQSEGYEALIREAKESRASSFLYWDTGIDEVAVVGLSDDDRVVFKCRAER